MTPEQILIAVAEARGWVKINDVSPAWPNGYWKLIVDGVCKSEQVALPDYLNDLNACAEMEDELDANDRARYYWMLAQVVNPMQLADQITFPLIHATAPQRCEAFLRTKGLYKEAK